MKKILIGLAASLSLVSSMAWAAPTSVTVNAIALDVEDGDYNFVVKTDSSASGCKAELYGRVSDSGTLLGASTKKIATGKFKTGSKKLTFKSRDIRGLQTSGNAAALNVQVVVTCGDTELTSNADAVYVVCGTGTNVLTSINSFMKRLKKRTTV